jgi:hypothetical protein
MISDMAARKRRRSGLITEGRRTATRDAEYRAIREAYREKPDSPGEADDWSQAEEFKDENISDGDL